MNYSYAAEYYVSLNGNDDQNGMSPFTAWKTIHKLNSISFNPGDKIYFEGGSTFEGSIYFDSLDQGAPGAPVLIASYGSGKAVIDAGNSFGIYAFNTAGISIENIIVKGSGRTVNNDHGIVFYNVLENNRKLNYIRIQNVEVYGFRKSGIWIGSWNGSSGYEDIKIRHCESHDNGESGISTFSKVPFGIKNIHISYTKVFNNSGRVDITNTHTGNGILLGYVENGIVEHCEAYNNGFLNNHKGGGPVGIWCYESTNVIIQYNESHHNKAGNDADGGGFDIDGGTTNSIIQYNYSHDNEGAGYMLAEYVNAGRFSNNSIRYNISENDGRKNNYGSIVLWGGSFFSNCLIHNNTIYTDNSVSGTPSCIRIFNNNFAGIEVFNNIFVTKGNVPLIHAETAPSLMAIRFRNNNYFSLDNDWKIIWGSSVFNRLEDWRSASQQEMNGAFTTGTSENPLLIHPGEGGTLSDLNSLNGLSSYKVLPGSPIIDSGMDLIDPYSIGIATHDFWGSKIPDGIGVDIGAYEYPVVTGIDTPEDINNPKLTIIPNPLQKEFVLSLEGQTSTILQFEMVDMKGIRRFYGETKSGSVTKIPVMSFGFYYIILYVDNKIIARKKILIQHSN